MAQIVTLIMSQIEVQKVVLIGTEIVAQIVPLIVTLIVTVIMAQIAAQKVALIGTEIVAQIVTLIVTVILAQKVA